METTKEVKRGPGGNNNPTGKGGFADRPDDRSPGGWKKENTISYQYKRFLNMSAQELDDWGRKVPDNEKTMAMMLAYNRIKAAGKSLADVKEITDRIEGKPVQQIEQTIHASIDDLSDALD